MLENYKYLRIVQVPIIRFDQIHYTLMYHVLDKVPLLDLLQMFVDDIQWPCLGL